MPAGSPSCATASTPFTGHAGHRPLDDPSPWCCPAWFRTQIEDALDAVALRRPGCRSSPRRRRRRLVAGPTRRAGCELGITDAVVPATSTTRRACSGATILGPFCRRARRLGLRSSRRPSTACRRSAAPPEGSPARSSTA
jgi:hypothetical protein